MASRKFGPFTESQVKEAFRVFDFDDNGFIGASDLRKLFSSIREAVNDEEIDEMIKMVDTDGDGQVDSSEFSKMVFKYAEREDEENTETELENEISNNDQLDNGMDDDIKDVYQDLLGNNQRLPALSEKRYERDKDAGKDADIDEEENENKYNTNDSNTPTMHPLSLPAIRRNKGGSSHFGGVDERRRKIRSAVERLDGNINDFETLFVELERLNAKGITYETFCSWIGCTIGPDAERVFDMFDENESETIDPRDFLMSILDTFKMNPVDAVKNTFQLLDADKNGYLTKDEISKMLKANYAVSSIKQVAKKMEAVMRQADKDNDGKISFEEFEDVCERFPKLLFPDV